MALGWLPLARLPRKGFTGLRVDLAGNALVVVITSVLLVAFAGVQQAGWTHPRTVGLMLAAAFAVPVFVAVEHRARWPAVAVDLMRDRAFALADYFSGHADRLDETAREVLVAGHVVALGVLLGVLLIGLAAMTALRRPARFSGT